MRLLDICSPGHFPNSHALRKELVRAIGFAECQRSSREEKAHELRCFLNEALAYIEENVAPSASHEPELAIETDTLQYESLVGKFLAVTPALPETAPKKVVGKPAVKGKGNAKS